MKIADSALSMELLHYVPFGYIPAWYRSPQPAPHKEIGEVCESSKHTKISHKRTTRLADFVPIGLRW